jgi:hypothetical protein
MSTKDRETGYRDALRYIENATDMLRTKVGKKDNYYQDPKYVRIACGTAYNGALLAVGTYLEMKGKPLVKKKGKRFSVEDYQFRLASVDSRMLKNFNTAYRVLHLQGYYEGETKERVILEGIDSAMYILNKIKPPAKLAG